MAKIVNVVASCSNTGKTVLIEGLIKELKKRSKALGAKKIYVSAQVYAVPFYEKYGFRAYGNEYLDIHIPHMDMDCPL